MQNNDSYGALSPIQCNDTPQWLSSMGWDVCFQRQLEERAEDSYTPARVVGVAKNSFYVSQGQETCLVTVAGRLNHVSDALYPVIGDWVLVTDTVITEVLARKSVLSRGAAGSRGKQEVLPLREQVIAANIDTVFIVCGLDRDFNLRRIERYLTLVYNCGLNPVIVLTKADLQQEPDRFLEEVEGVAFGVPVHLVSACADEGMVALEKYLGVGKTITMVGSSGAGKSTLLNRLYGETVQATGEVSAVLGKGKHTTTSRELIVMPQGGLLIDNPGIREIAFWGGEGGLEGAFPEIEAFAEECRFSDCSHMHEPGCRVLQAVEEGDIAQDRLESYRKMQRELAYFSDRENKSADRVEKERWKDVALKVKAMKKRERYR